MDLNSANQTPTDSSIGASSSPQPQVNPTIQVQPPTVQPSKGGRKWLKILFILVFLVLISAGGFIAYKYYFTQNTTYNAGVYKEPQSTKVTPTPSGYQVNPNDTSNQSIDADTTQIDKNMTNLNSDLNKVDQSTTDQQTNLQ